MSLVRNLVFITLVATVAFLLYAYFQSDEPIKSWAKQETGVAVPQDVADNPRAQLPGPVAPAPEAIAEEHQESDNVSAPVSRTLNLDEIENILALVEKNQRTALLEDEEKFRKFVTREANNKSMDAAAQANKIDQNEKNQLLARRGADKILRDIYLKQLIASKFPKDFPSADQIEAYYEKNKDNFALPERMPVWQIFLATTPDMQSKDIELLKKKAESIINDLGKNRTNFAEAALRYSAHRQSMFNGGFLGVVNIRDMKPEIQKVLQDLPPDKISQAVRTEDGIHILKRGPLLARHPLSLDDVRDQIRDLLIKQATTELRQNIFNQAAKTYPVEINEQQLKELRQKLQATYSVTQSPLDEQKNN